MDYHPDLYVGRASVNSTSEADLFVDKVLRYEGQLAWNDYFETAPVELRIGYTTGELFGSVYTGSVDAEIISAWLPGGDWEEEKCYESTGNNNYQITIDMIDAGPHHVFHARHVSQIGQGGENVTVSVSDADGPVENARVCLQKGDWQEGEIFEVDYTDASGEVTIWANPVTTGQIAVTAWTRNHYTYSGTIDVTEGTQGGRTGVIQTFGLEPVSPSPAFTSARIRYSLAASGPHSLEVYDLTGRRVATLAGGSAASGSHSMVWDLTDGSGARVPAGVYHVRLTGGGQSTVRSLVVLD